MLNQDSSPPAKCGSGEDEMANFEVDPFPFVPEGMNMEEWARPARGRISDAANPPRRHDKYAIVSILPPLLLEQLHEVIDEVVGYFVNVQQVHIKSCCPSPLGMCLIQFSTAIARQAMINISPLQLDADRELTVVEHDKGFNLRNSPFTRTCWIMFLAFPLYFHTREIILRVVGLLGSVVTWTNNSRFRSRILLRCRVTFISRIPRSLIIAESGCVVDSGLSWTVLVFVLDSALNDVHPADEDPIPPNGNPHPDGEKKIFDNQFEDVGDLQDIQLGNEDQGLEVQPHVHQEADNNGWDP
jgi:hypothetical protein